MCLFPKCQANTNKLFIEPDKAILRKFFSKRLIENNSIVIHVASSGVYSKNDLEQHVLGARCCAFIFFFSSFWLCRFGRPPTEEINATFVEAAWIKTWEKKRCFTAGWDPTQRAHFKAKEEQPPCWRNVRAWVAFISSSKLEPVEKNSDALKCGRRVELACSFSNIKPVVSLFLQLLLKGNIQSVLAGEWIWIF